MNGYDEMLRQLQERVARKKQLDAMISELYGQRSMLSQRVQELDTVCSKENLDVERLEGRSLAAFFYHVIGKKDEKLDEERREAYAARVKYDAAVRELRGVETDLQRCETERSRLEGCEQQYQSVMQDKAQAVKDSGGAAAEALLHLEERVAFLTSQERELQEAIAAGNSALKTAKQILSSLDSAGGWSTWDMLGGGVIADLAKHSHLDEAQGNIEFLQSQLRRFKTELADVTIHMDAQVSVEGFLRFADYFFDGIFADWAVMNRINQSQEQVQATCYQIQTVLQQLDQMIQTVTEERTALTAEHERLIRQADIDPV